MSPPLKLSAFDQALEAVFADSSGPPEEIRKRASESIGRVLREARAGVLADFEAHGADGVEAGRALSAIQDTAVSLLFEVAARRLHRNAIPTSSERMALVAVGGYGRGLLAPASDVDLLFLTPYKQTAWGESVIESILYALWDMKLKVGHASRSVDECLRQAQGDMTIRTSLLETRLICGDAALYEEMRGRLWSELFTRTGPEFVAAKLEERAERHKRAGGSRYLLEPNVKESKGGLRDLQSLFWIAKYLYEADSVEDLVAKEVFTAARARQFGRAEVFLWTVRFWLHLLTGRAQEQLTFDLQLEIAERMGFRARGGRRAVERFMKRYFHTAKTVGDLTRIFCSAIEEQHKVERADVDRPRPWIFRGLLSRLKPPGGVAEVKIERGRLALEPELDLKAHPLEILRFFKAVADTGAPAHPAALKRIRENLRLIDADFRENPEAKELFLEILSSRGDPERALRLMSETEVLSRFLPEFRWIVAMMQFNMYHHYTVDEHTITAIGVMSRIEHGALKEELPLSTRLAKGLEGRRALYVAILLHDIGKGHAEDHSILGERVALKVCPRLGLSPEETETVAWLVRWHLLMSDVAQKRDLSDIETIRNFASTVQSRERLRMLLLLTVCDIRAVGPNVWNGWKAELLRNLYREADALLSGGHSAASETRQAREEAAKAALRARLTDWPPERIDRFLDRHYPSYWLGLETDMHEAHARMLAEGGEEPHMHVDHDPARATTRLSLSMNDHPGLFARMTGAIALAGANVVDAKSFTTSDGMALNSFWIQDDEGGAYEDPDRIARLRNTLFRTLRGEILPRQELRRRAKIRKREQGFVVAPHVAFDNDASEFYTVVEATGRDRLGLLHELARAFAEENVNIFAAVIATYGERAVDSFYVKDLFGHKITQESKRKSLERRLRAALAPEEAEG
ncbi:[protein-PII] uridylyltransferase [Neomegalonema perideroedes]|uniref:[protein-PII] uridylyltransferase n=1 Tax=Neomegalonema perideroedes TaxID=217219 RepID=UPI000382F06A|nr:[protein-PII] uridylyltransferase [Neomegalonema perideroedes]